MDIQQPVNPYIAGSPVTGTEMFFGREDVFSFIRRNLIGQHRDNPVVIYGQRRTGKTSVLYQLHRHLDPRYRCIFIDLHGLNLQGMDNLLLGMANSISRGLRRDHHISVDVPDRALFLTDSRPAFETAFLEAVLSALGEDHLVLMLDEVVRLDEEVRAGRLEREVFDYLRHLMQHHARLNFVFSLGSGLEEMEREYAFLFSVSLYHRISFLESAAARELVTQPVKDQYQVGPQAVEKILNITSGHPYYTQLVCHCLFDLWSRSPRPVMDAADVDAVVTEAIELGSANLTYVWEDSTRGEQALMAGMAAATHGKADPVTFRHVQEVWRDIGVSLAEGELARAMRSLTAREVVTGTEAYSFTVDLQRLWLEKHRRLDWVKEELETSPNHTIPGDTTNGGDESSAGKKPQITRRARYLAIAAVIVLLAGLTIGISLAHLGPFSSSPVDFSQMVQQLQTGIGRTPQECHSSSPPSQWSMPGSVRALHCTDPSLPGGNFYAYQLDTTAHYQMAWQNFNTWWGFLRSSASKTCPPSGGALQGVESSNISLLQANSELVECGPLTLDSNHTVPAYVWGLPNNYVFIIAEGASGSSFSPLASWLNNNPAPHAGPPSLAPGVATLAQLLPSDVNPVNCKAAQKPQWATPGLVKSLTCYDSALGNSGDSIFAYQMNSSANYQSSWASFNTWWGIKPPSGSGCPPSSGQIQGSVPWDDTGSNGGGYFPTRTGQVLECGLLGTKGNEPTYAWTFPTEDAYIVAIGDPNTKFSAIDTWWTNNSDPAARPSLAPSR